MRLAIGTAQFGADYGVANSIGKPDETEIGKILEFARQSSIDLLDTAISYGDSEEMIGRVDSSGFKIVTKLPEVPIGCADVLGWVEQQVRQALVRLKRQSIYGLLLHRPDQLGELVGDSLVRALMSLKDQGLVEKVGLSIYSPDSLQTLLSVCPVDIVQAPLNLVDRRLAQSGWLDRLHKSDIEVHIRSVFLQGLLLMPEDRRPSKFDRWSELWGCWREWLTAHDIAPLVACLAYPLSFKEVSRLVVGVDSIMHLNEIAVACTSCDRVTEFPDLICNDPELINPSMWGNLE